MTRKYILFALAALMIHSATAQDYHHMTFEGGLGAGIPMGSARDRFDTGFGFLLGGGWNFTPHLGGLLEFQYSHNSLTSSTLSSASFGQADGFNRFWSLTVNPRYTFSTHGHLGGYATAGYGVYSRRLAFTDPTQASNYCDPYYGYCQGSGAPIVAEFTNYKGGFNAGGGVTYALGQSGLRVFGDFRYHRFLSHANNEFATFGVGISY